MEKNFKPDGYNSVSPYFIVKDAVRFLELMKQIFEIKELRCYIHEDGSIMHGELLLEDSVIMYADSSEKYPPVQLIMHVYVPNADETFEKAINAGCEIIERPNNKDGDPDRRGSFRDYVGNLWSIGTQLKAEI